jgi:hypothetical protein
MNIGLALIEEQKKQKEYGSLFTYEGYQLLKELESFRDLNLIMKSWGLKTLKENMTVDEIYEEIKVYNRKRFTDQKVSDKSLFPLY